jgi:hypothetical protein
MRRFRAILGGFLAVALCLAAAGVTLAKGDRVVATLDAPLPVDADPGTTVRLGWTLSITFDDGSVHPFLAEGIFIRISPPGGAPIEVPASSDRDGHFVASVTVPRGGLGTVAIGLQGSACRPNAGCTRSDEFFRIAPTPGSADPVAASVSGAQGLQVQPPAASAAGAAPVVAPVATADQPVAAATDFVPILTLAALAILLALLGLSVRGRRRPAAA